MVGLGRLELPTSRLSSARSNQLSYKPGTAPDQDHPAKTIPAKTIPAKTIPAKTIPANIRAPGKRHAPRAKPPAGRENPPDQAARRRRAVREERETKTTKSRK